MLKLKLQYFGQMWRCCVIGKDSDAGKDWEQEENSMRWLHGIINSWTWAWEDSRIWWRTGKPGVLQFMRSQRVRQDLLTEQQQQQRDNHMSFLVRAINWWIVLTVTISEGKASACNAGDLGSIPGSGRSPGEGNGTPLQYSCLENPMDREAW